MKSGFMVLTLAALIASCASNDVEDMPRGARVKFANMEGYSNNPYPKAKMIGGSYGYELRP